MSTPAKDRCEDLVIGRNGKTYRCPNPAKATIRRLSPDIRICGIHARVRERKGQFITWDVRS